MSAQRFVGSLGAGAPETAAFFDTECRSCAYVLTPRLGMLPYSGALSRSASLLLPRHPGASADPPLIPQRERTRVRPQRLP